MQFKRFQFPVLVVLAALIGYVAAKADRSEKSVVASPTDFPSMTEACQEPFDGASCCAEGSNKKLQLSRSSSTQTYQGEQSE